MKNLFIHLRLHSNFSLAEGMLSFEDLSKFCIENNQPAIAITDTNNLFGALEFSLKMTSYGIQPIIGIQMNISQNGKDDKDTGEEINVTVDLTEVEVNGPDEKPESHIKLNDSIGMTLKEVTLKDAIGLTGADLNDVTTLVASVVDTIYDKDTVYKKENIYLFF